jgi:hypothetical protein
MMNMRNMSIIAAATVIGFGVATWCFAADAAPTAPKAAAPAEDVFVLADFEPGSNDLAKSTGGTKVKEHATRGEYALKMDSNGTDMATLFVDDGAALRKFKDYPLLKIDVFNPQAQPVHCGARVDDGTSKDYGSRYNDDGLVVAPGKSTIEINLTGLTKSNSRNFDQRERINLATLRLVAIWISPVGKPLTLYFDNVRLEGSGLPKVDGLLAIDFGPAGAPVFAGFEGCTEKTNFTDARGYGWVNADGSFIASIPDALTGTGVSGQEFRVKLPNGKYEVNLCWDMFGMWGTLPSFEWRKLLINGKEVISEKRTGKDFLEKFYYRHEDEEDLPGQDLWEKFVADYQKIHRFSAEVTDGLLKIEPQGNERLGRTVCFVVVYPEAKQDDGRKFMETLNARRKAKFNAQMVVDVPKPTGEEPKPTPADKARGFIAWVASTEDDIAITARPVKDAPRKITLEAAQGERTAAQVGLYPLQDFPSGLAASIANAALAQTGGDAKVTAKVSPIRNFLKHAGMERVASILPYIVGAPSDKASFGALKSAGAHGVWLTIEVPQDAAPGKYVGTVKIAPSDSATPEQMVNIPIELTVLPFKLEKIDDITISVTGSTAGAFTAFHPELMDRWWEVAQIVMKDQAAHGMNAVTGGPSATLRGVKDGKADIDYTAMDRWMAMAVKLGMTMPGDSYQGLDVSGLPGDNSKDCMANCEQQAKQRFGIGYAELVKIVYGDLEKHAKEKNWPKRAYSFIDEPRPESGNVGPCGEMIKLRTQASPETLFSGFYSTGDGRDPYFEMMPVSIAHINTLSLQLVKKAHKQLWDYSGNYVREDIGRWAFMAARMGMTGFLRNGYMYVCSMPYFDFSDDEASWSCVYPSRNGINDSVGWERTAQGVNDYRYLLTCERLIAKAKKAGKTGPEVDAAETYMKETLKPVTLDDKDSAKLTGQQYDEFRHRLAELIIGLKKAIGE